MAADYLVSSLPTLSFDAPPPISSASFAALCREQLGDNPFRSIKEKWDDLEILLRNAICAERARLAGKDPAKYLRHANGCSRYWADRVSAAFKESSPEKREDALDKVWWDAAGEMTPPASPLSVAAAFTYSLRLAVAERRASRSIDAGNAVFDSLTSI